MTPETTMNGISSFSSRSNSSAGIAPKPGTLKSDSTMSQARSPSAARICAAFSIRLCATSNPSLFSWRTTSAASLAESSTSRTDSGVLMRDSSLRRRHVDLEPVQAELPDGFGELMEIDGFPDVAVGAQIVTRGDVGLLAGRGEDHHRDAPGTAVGPDAAQDLEPVDARQLEVQQYQYRRIARAVWRTRAAAEQVIQRL